MNIFQNSKFEDFEVIETLAETHQGNTKVQLCRFQQQIFVCKSITKDSLKDNAKAIQHIHNQKKALMHFTSINYQHTCHLLGFFQDSDNLYLVLEMVEGLPLHKLLQMMGPLKEEFVKFITYQIGLIMKDFHENGYIYRDIKSSNFMVNSKGLVKMIDLGKSKQIKKERTYTICGTTHSMPPQIYLKQGYSYQFDYYSYGVLIYELLIGKPPFGYETSNKNIQTDICEGLTVEIMDRVKNEHARNLIRKLMDKNPESRLGAEGGFMKILEHEFFSEFEQLARLVHEGVEEISEYDDNFYEQISEIADFGLDVQKYQEIDESDPFYKFLS